VILTDFDSIVGLHNLHEDTITTSQVREFYQVVCSGVEVTTGCLIAMLFRISEQINNADRKHRSSLPFKLP
jgi:hypothetical protein